MEKVVGYMQGKPADGMLHDFEDLARRNPALFLGGTYLAGMAVGRFLRASAPAPALNEDVGARHQPDAGFDTSGLGVGGMSDGFATGEGLNRAARGTGDGEPGLTDEDLRAAWHGTDERTRTDASRGTGYGASGMSDSDSLETGELTSYTNGDERDFDPRRGV